MEPHRVPDGLYAEFLEHFPEVCVEIVIRTEAGVLVAKRANAPARGKWFWPGSRLHKQEALDDAARRVAREELGIEVDVVRRLGVSAHFWETSEATGRPSRHTVNIVYLAIPVDADPTIELDDQHTDYRYLNAVEPDLHEYVREYFDEFDIFG